MSKVAHYLQEHLLGEVMASSDARKYFATDASIFTLTPSLVVYPRNENDVRKTALHINLPTRHKPENLFDQCIDGAGRTRTALILTRAPDCTT